MTPYKLKPLTPMEPLAVRVIILIDSFFVVLVAMEAVKNRVKTIEGKARGG